MDEKQLRQNVKDAVIKYYQATHGKKKEFVPRETYLNYSGRVFDETELVALTESALDFWLTAGRFARQFERQFAEFLGVKHCMLTNSGSSANLLAMSALTSPLLGNRRLRAGDEVISVAAAFPTTVNPIIQNSLVPVFIDVSPSYLNILADKIEDAITKKTKVIFIAHTLGNPFDIDTVMYLAGRYNLWVIEDACDALGSKYKGRYVGTFGDLSTFSFFPAHHMSCSKNTPILFLDESGHVKIETIEKIYDMYADRIEEIKIVSFNKQYKLEWSTPSSILRYKLRDKKMVKLITQHGRVVEITEDHSVFVLDRDTAHLVPKFVKDIHNDDYIVTTNNIPFPHHVDFIDVIGCFSRKDAYVSNFPHSNLIYVENSDYRWQFKCRDTLPIRYLKDYSLEKDDIKIGISQSIHKIPARIPITEDLCRLIGYFIAEGSYSNGLVFSFNVNEDELHRDVCDIVTAVFGFTPYIYKNKKDNSAVVKVDSKNIEIVFKDAFGISNGAQQKRIPWFIYHSSDKCIKAFIYGFTRGDGSIRKLKDNTNHIDVTSVSKELLNDFQYLLSMIGISASFCRRNRNHPAKKIITNRETISKGNYSLRFSGYIYKNKTIVKSNLTDKNNYSVQVPLYPHFRKYISVDKYQKTVSKNRLKKYMPSDSELYPLIDGDLSFLKVRCIENMQCSSEEFVYDFSVPEKENFYGGFLGIFLHNTMGEGGAVCTNDAQLNRIVESFRDWGRDCKCPTGHDNTCGKRFDMQIGNLPHGYDHKYIYSHLGYNLKATDMQAAVGVAQLSKLPSFIETRKKNFNVLYDGLKDYEEYFILPRALPESEPSWFGFPLTVRDSAPFSRDDIVAFLEKNKIATRMLFSGNITRHPSFEGVKYRTHGCLDNTDFIMKNTFWIGVYPGLTSEMLSYVLAVFAQFFEKYMVVLKCSQ